MLNNNDNIDGGIPPLGVDVATSPPLPSSPIETVGLASPAAKTTVITLDVEWERHAINPRRNQVLAYGLLLDHDVQSTTDIIKPSGPEVRNRLNLGTLISSICKKATNEGVLDSMPEKITLVTHFGRGDLAACRDFPVLKKQLDALKNVFTTTGKSVHFKEELDAKTGLPVLALPRMPDERVMKVPDESNELRDITVTFRDTSLLTAEGCKSLEAIGVLVGVAKVTLPSGHDKSRMGRFFEEHRDLAEKYLLADLDITTKYFRQLESLFADLGMTSVPPTLGAAAVRLFEKTLRGLTDAKGNAVTRERLFGIEKKKERRYSRTTGRFYTFQTEEMSAEREMFERFNGRGYVGGRTESQLSGPTPAGLRLHDIDLKSAYPSAMAGIRIPDYGRAFLSDKTADFTADVLGVAKVSFVCPPDLRFPPFAVPTRYGLIFPRRGVTLATAPEIASAIDLGVEVTIHRGVIIPFCDDTVFPYAEFVRLTVELRNALKDKRIGADGCTVVADTVKSLAVKTLTNSLYGKIAQAVRPSNVFDSRTGTDKPLPPSAVTNAAVAAYITGLVRAAIAEMMNSIPHSHLVATVSTDGFLTSASISDISVAGPSCQVLAANRKMLTGDPSLLEVKKKVNQVVVPRNRATFTSQPVAGSSERVTAKGGIKLPAGVENPDEFLLAIFLDRTYATTLQRDDLICTRDQWSDDADLVTITRSPRVSLEPDHKRDLGDPRMVTIAGDGPHAGRSHLALSSVPFDTAEEAVTIRTLFDGWRHSTGGCLTDLKSWEEWVDYRDDMLATRKARVRSRRTPGGSADTLKRVFLRALARGMWGLSMDGLTKKSVAVWLTASGYKTSEHSVKDAGRKGLDPVAHSVAATGRTMALLKTILRQHPNFDFAKTFVAGHVAQLADVVRSARSKPRSA